MIEGASQCVAQIVPAGGGGEARRPAPEGFISTGGGRGEKEGGGDRQGGGGLSIRPPPPPRAAAPAPWRLCNNQGRWRERGERERGGGATSAPQSKGGGVGTQQKDVGHSREKGTGELSKGVVKGAQ